MRLHLCDFDDESSSRFARQKLFVVFDVDTVVGLGLSERDQRGPRVVGESDRDQTTHVRVQGVHPLFHDFLRRYANE